MSEVVPGQLLAFTEGQQLMTNYFQHSNGRRLRRGNQWTRKLLRYTKPAMR